MTNARNAVRQGGWPRPNEAYLEGTPQGVPRTANAVSQHLLRRTLILSDAGVSEGVSG